MDSTRITLTPELKSRFAQGHNYYGYRVLHTDWGALSPGAALGSTALAPICVSPIPIHELLHYSTRNAVAVNRRGQQLVHRIILQNVHVRSPIIALIVLYSPDN